MNAPDLSRAYAAKADTYFEGARLDYVAELPTNPSATILEIGCGAGGTGALALAQRKCGQYIGIELDSRASTVAAQRIDEVLTGNVETMDLPWARETFDALILSEVLEHLVDPWATMHRLAPLIRPGGLVFASSPNLAHWSVSLRLLAGHWEPVAESGMMDRTHLRWFTPKLYERLFEETGFRVEELRPVAPLGPRARVVDFITAGCLRHLLVRQISVRAIRRNSLSKTDTPKLRPRLRWR